MKKFNYLSLAVSILLLTSCPGEVIVDPDDPKDPKAVSYTHLDVYKRQIIMGW